jgi:hypothetical protein
MRGEQMRYNEFQPANIEAVDAYKKKQLEKGITMKQRVWIWNNSNSNRNERIIAGILTAIDRLLVNTDDRSKSVATVRTDTI